MPIDVADWGSMDLGGWQLPVHHNYNPEKGKITMFLISIGYLLEVFTSLHLLHLEYCT